MACGPGGAAACPSRIGSSRDLSARTEGTQPPNTTRQQPATKSGCATRGVHLGRARAAARPEARGLPAAATHRAIAQPSSAASSRGMANKKCTAARGRRG